MTAKTINALYPGTCAACGLTFSIGDRIAWDKDETREKRGQHAACIKDSDGGTGKGGSYTWNDDSFKALPYPGSMTYTSERITQEYASLQDALAAAAFSTADNRDAWGDLQNGLNPGARKNPALQWFGIADGLQGVRRVIREGWPEGVEQMRAALDDIGENLRPVSVRRRRVWSDQGDALDIHRVYAGQLDTAWQRTRRLARPSSQTVTIAANITAMFKVDARDLFWRGAAVLKLSDMLTEAGYNVRIEAIRNSTDAFTSGAGILQRVTVKEPTAPLELNGLAATLCLSGFFRYVLFSCQCAGTKARAPAMGRSAIYEGNGAEIVGVERCMSAEAARDWINEQIQLLQQPAAA